MVFLRRQKRLSWDNVSTSTATTANSSSSLPISPGRRSSFKKPVSHKSSRNSCNSVDFDLAYVETYKSSLQKQELQRLWYSASELREHREEADLDAVDVNQIEDKHDPKSYVSTLTRLCNACEKADAVGDSRIAFLASRELGRFFVNDPHLIGLERPLLPAFRRAKCTQIRLLLEYYRLNKMNEDSLRESSENISAPGTLFAHLMALALADAVDQEALMPDEL